MNVKFKMKSEIDWVDCSLSEDMKHMISIVEQSKINCYNSIGIPKEYFQMTKGIDEIPGEHNAKGWFKIMWQNQYLWLASIGIIGIVWFTCKYGKEGWTWPNLMWPGILVLSVSAITYFGFIKFWNELKGKK